MPNYDSVLPPVHRKLCQSDEPGFVQGLEQQCVRAAAGFFRCYVVRGLDRDGVDVGEMPGVSTKRDGGVRFGFAFFWVAGSVAGGGSAGLLCTAGRGMIQARK
jgi:hypothetical protein